MGNFYKVDGIAILRVTSAYTAGALQKIQDAGISIYDVTVADPFTICFCAKRRDVATIKKICQKRGDRIDVEGWTGHVYYLIGLLKRPIFLAGIFCWLFLALWLPTKILFINVMGAENISEAYILECAAKCGIHMGATGKEVRSEQVKNALLSCMPDLQWAGVNTTGCVATIYVREKTAEGASSPKTSITDILSTQDGIISDITVYSGTALCKPGQAVKRGQALISCYTDNGQILAFTGARGEVYAETKRQIRAITLLNAYKRTHILSETENFYVVIGKNPIKFQKDSGILGDGCVKMYDIKECLLPGGFALPVTIIKETVTEYALEPVTLTEEDCIWLEGYTEAYLSANLISGTILSAQTKTSQTDSLLYLLGTYDCREMIADYECKGIIVEDGKNN